MDDNKLQVVILAGGMGTRIQSVARDLPKALLPVAGRPFLSWQLDLLSKCGIGDVVLCIGHLGEQIENFAGDGTAWGLRIRYARENPSALQGTGGALLNAIHLLDPVFGVLYGDSYLPFDFSMPFADLEAMKTEALMCVHRNEGRWDPSNVRVQEARVVFYSKQAKKDDADCIDYGFSVFRRKVLEAYLDSPRPLDLTKIFAALVKRSQLAAKVVPERFYEIGKPEGLDELNHLLSEKQV
ncbi:MAG: nucleotidyl transferase [Spartobacteria bacterium]|nr:nucleotidyl transferase [Spartobacteria bacterium]